MENQEKIATFGTTDTRRGQPIQKQNIKYQLQGNCEKMNPGRQDLEYQKKDRTVPSNTTNIDKPTPCNIEK